MTKRIVSALLVTCALPNTFVATMSSKSKIKKTTKKTVPHSKIPRASKRSCKAERLMLPMPPMKEDTKRAQVSTTVNTPGKRLEKVYVLELQEGRVYVGKSIDPGVRLLQHMRGYGSAFTKVYKPTGLFLPRLGNLVGTGDGPEREETLRQMELRGVDKVRGWKYCCKALGKRDREEIEANIREMDDLCRRCGRAGHFSKSCTYRTDRHGKKIAAGRAGRPKDWSS